jgi:hypothetical protein
MSVELYNKTYRRSRKKIFERASIAIINSFSLSFLPFFITYFSSRFFLLCSSFSLFLFFDGIHTRQIVVKLCYYDVCISSSRYFVVRCQCKSFSSHTIKKTLNACWYKRETNNRTNNNNNNNNHNHKLSLE